MSYTIKRFGRLAVAAVGLMALVVGMPGLGLAYDDVPEIDPGSAASALTLVTGGVLWLTARCRGN